MLDTHKEVVETRSTETPIFRMTRKIMRFDVREEGQAEAKHIGNDHQGSPVVADNRCLYQAHFHQDKEQNVRHNPSTKAITVIGQYVSSRRSCSTSDATRKYQEQKHLQKHPRAVQHYRTCANFRDVSSREDDDGPGGYLVQHLPPQISKRALICVTGVPEEGNTDWWP